jgi:hypothetical protein
MYSKRIKYVIYNYSMPILISMGLNHKDVNIGGITSAGFCTIEVIDNKFVVTCFGESTSLDIKSDPEFDKHNIEYMLNRKDGEYF